MADWPVACGASLWRTYVTNALATHASAHTKGNYVEVVASAPFPVNYLGITKRYFPNTNDYLVDVAIGAEGSEVVVVNNLLISSMTLDFYSNVGQVLIPISIPKATRIAVRAQSSSGGDTGQLSLLLGSIGFPNIQAPYVVDTYGATTADSGGTSIDPGGTAWTAGSYVQFTASLTRRMRGFFLAFGGQLNTVRSHTMWGFTVGIGAGGSEEVLIDNIVVGAGTGSWGPNHPFTPFIPCDVPAGTRVAIKCYCAINDATDRLIDVVLYTVS